MKIIKTIIQIWNNKRLIIQGLCNTIFKSDPVEKIARERLLICRTCLLYDGKGTNCSMPGTQPCCGECGCSLALKLRSMDSSCPHPDGPKWAEQDIKQD